MAKGKINVTADNIFPIIKKFLYSDHEIFLRELVSNAVDATNKLKALSRLGEAKGDLGDLTIEVAVDKEAKTISITDKGIGMTADEVKKYINQVAFSGAEEFVEKYKDKAEGSDIIGHFGLGFYSSFMVAERVEIDTKSFKDEEAAHWECDGSPEYSLKKSKKEERGTTITLHIAEDSTEFLEESRISELLNKYCKFLPVPIKFGTREETNTVGEGDDAKEEKTAVDNIINNPTPAWTKAPADLTEEDYKSFYRELYPMTFDEPLFNIHLNVDYPFELTGILYFPKIKPNMEIQKNKIQLYQNQVFVTDSVEGIVPEFLTMLHGVIDSPDIPLNVSRSYLQSDGNVKKIASHITKKVGDKLSDLFKNDRKDFESKWDDIKVIIEYGMLTEDKFYDKAEKFSLYKNTSDKYFTFEEFTEKIKEAQTDKDGNLIYLYAAHKEGQHAYIERAKEKGYDVLILDSPIISHLIQKLESKNTNIRFARVDSDSIDKLIKKDEEMPSKLTDKEQETLKGVVEGAVNKDKYNVQLESMSSDDSPFMITMPEFMRRMKEMSMSGGGGFYGELPETYNLVVNTNHELAGKILGESDTEKQKGLIKQATDLAMLSQNLLHGEDLTNFIKRSYELID